MEVIKIKDLPELERPREKAKHFGINKLSNAELLALIIGSGSKEANALMIANELLAKSCGINNLINYSFQEFMTINGIKEATAFRFLAINELVKRSGAISETNAFQSSEAIAKRYQKIIGGNAYESLYLIGLSQNGSIVLENEIYVGTNSHFVSSEDEIIDFLKKEKVRFFILVHNHPSGNVEPSQDDIIATNHLLVRAKRNNLILFDHLIVSRGNRYYSFKEANNLVN